MSIVLHALYALCALGLLVWATASWSRRRSVGRLAIGLVLVGLFWDNLVLSLGNVLGPGPLLHALSLPRFWLHQLVLPWILVTAVEQAADGGAGWAKAKQAMPLAVLGAATLMGIGILTKLVGLELTPAILDGVECYVAVSSAGPPIVGIVAVGSVGIMSFLAAKTSGWHWTWALALLVFIVEAVPVAAFRRGVGPALEILFMASLIAFTLRRAHCEPFATLGKATSTAAPAFPQQSVQPLRFGLYCGHQRPGRGGPDTVVTAHRDAQEHRQMLRAMLAGARDVSAMDLTGKNPTQADFFREVLRGRDHWLTAARRFRDLNDLALALPGDNHSAVGPLSPRLALAYQAQIGAELAVELVHERGRRLPFPLITRGTDGGAFSDLGLYLKFSSDYLVLPCFHTHPSPWNELGEETPSFADFLALDGLRNQLGGIGACDRVFFPNGRYTFYAVDEWRRWFYQRLGQCRVYVTPLDWLEPRDSSGLPMSAPGPGTYGHDTLDSAGMMIKTQSPQSYQAEILCPHQVAPPGLHCASCTSMNAPGSMVGSSRSSTTPPAD
ncbi:hypothetical protein [uncultured Thiodictyon sp.]|uniref:hypothetical protein n=1 Tax=uncultured Thiodictyon sp. TaxID=1846217 RepID=UPI0025EDDB35|nr:hypothetical protein [uncultured Thiodictyon sp.]